MTVALSLLIVLFAGAVAPAAASAQGQGLPQEDPSKKPAEPPKVNNKVHVKIEQHVDEPNVIQRKALYPPLRFEENGNLIVIDAETWYGMPQRDPELPLNLGVGVRMTLLTFGVGAGGVGGISLGNPGKAIITDPPPPQRGDPDPDPNPPGTKPTATVFGDDSGNGSTDSAPFVGPELSYPLKQNMSEWNLVRWLPERSSLELYGRAQVGTLDFSTARTSATLYGLGLRLNLPFYQTESFHADATISAGPGFLKTKLGDATVFDGCVGIRVVQSLGTGIDLYAGLQIEALTSKGDSTIGPSLSMGLDLSW